MRTLNRPVTVEDLKDKGLPFACENCGSKPTVEDIVEYGGRCQVCRDEIVVYSMDAAEWIVRFIAQEKLEDKGLLFACQNCPEEFVAEDVVKQNGACRACGEEGITVHATDMAKWITRVLCGIQLGTVAKR